MLSVPAFTSWPAAGPGQEGLGQLCALAGSHHPVHDVAGEDVDDDVEVEPHAPLRSPQFGYVPAPALVRRASHELGPGPAGMGGLGPAVADLAGGPQAAVHRRDRAQVAVLVQQHGPHLGRGQVTEAIGAQRRQHGVDFLCAQGVRRRRPGPGPGRSRRGGLGPAVVGGLGLPRRPTRRAGADEGFQGGHAGVDHCFGFCSGAALSASISKSA